MKAQRRTHVGGILIRRVATEEYRHGGIVETIGDAIAKRRIIPLRSGYMRVAMPWDLVPGSHRVAHPPLAYTTGATADGNDRSVGNREVE